MKPLNDGMTLDRLVVYLSVACLWLSVTNFVPFSAGLAVLLPFLPLFFWRYKKSHNNGEPLNKVFVSLLMMLSYFFLSALIYAPKSFLSYGFFRRDGMVFITFAPLLVLPLMEARIDLYRIFRGFVIFASALNAVFMVVYLITGGTIFLREPGIYHFLFIAHNAAGGYLAVLAAFSLGIYLHGRGKLFLLLTLTNSAGLLLTHSRGSILAFIVAFIIVIILRERFLKAIVAAFVVSQIALFSWGYINSLSSGSLSEELSRNYENNAFVITDRTENITHRVFNLWPRAVYQFLHSPVVGTGFGSYNDMPYSSRGVRGVFMQNNPERLIFNDANAHHSFLHVLSETGLVGLGLLIYFLYRMRSFILGLNEGALKTGLLLAFWAAVISSFTEHRLFTASQMLPFTIILGLAAASMGIGKTLRGHGHDA